MAELINDKRLTPTMERVRSGRTQLFREKNINDRTFISADNCDVSLDHENKEMYAELFDKQWYWVSGCPECNGEPRDWMTYIECDLHDRCSVCGTNRKDIKGSAYGAKTGWICSDCHGIEELQVRKEAFEKLDGEEPDCSCTDKIICPHCGSEISDDDIHESQDLECNVCYGQLHLEVDYIASYSTEIRGKRITK